MPFVHVAQEAIMTAGELLTRGSCSLCMFSEA